MRPKSKVREKWQLKKRVLHKKVKAKHYFKNSVSASETEFLNRVEKMFDVTINRQFPLEYWFYDGQYGMHLFEIDGTKFHSRPKSKKRDAVKDEVAKRYGFQLHRIKLDRVRDVTLAIMENTNTLNKIFNEDAS